MKTGRYCDTCRHVAGDEKFVPKRGDLVNYNGEAYYFQPNGSYCYLYSRPGQIGLPERAVHKLSRRAKITPPTADAVDRILRAEQQLRVKEREKKIKKHMREIWQLKGRWKNLYVIFIWILRNLLMFHRTNRNSRKKMIFFNLFLLQTCQANPSMSVRLTYVCVTCGKDAPKKCSICENAHYCSVECQRANWKRHKPICDEQSRFVDLRRPVKKLLVTHHSKICAHLSQDVKSWNYACVLFEDIAPLESKLRNIIKTYDCDAEGQVTSAWFVIGDKKQQATVYYEDSLEHIFKEMEKGDPVGSGRFKRWLDALNIPTDSDDPTVSAEIYFKKYKLVQVIDRKSVFSQYYTLEREECDTPKH